MRSIDQRSCTYETTLNLDDELLAEARRPFVLGEIACGALRQRATVLSLLAELPRVTTATHPEILAFIEARHLMGRGLGYVDVHLLAAASLDRVRLWTLDKRLDAAARALRVAP